MARLHYHEWSPNEHFASSKIVDEQEWMKNVFRRLDNRWEEKKLVWIDCLGSESPKFMELAEKYIPCVLDLTLAFYLRSLDQRIDIWSIKRTRKKDT